MIYTLTLNPALDYVVRTEKLLEGGLNRADSTSIQYGGKGINVSTVLHNLGVDSIALGFVGGFTGTALEQALQEKGLRTDFVHLEEGLTRINVKISSDRETELNAPGPVIPQAAVDQLMQKLDQLKNGDILVLAGSIPPSLPGTIYEQILSTLNDRGILFVVDTGGKVLRSVLSHRPFLIKPNLAELCEFAGKELRNDQEIADQAAALQQEGARNILVSMAGDGSLLLDETGQLHRLPAPKGTLRNSVGAGDSMVAGFLAGWLKTRDAVIAHRFGSAAGSATAFSDALATKEQFDALYSQESDHL